MNHDEGYFKNSAGLGIYHQAWLPKKEAKAVLLVVHGLAEHSGRYMNIVNRFVPDGYAVYGLDHPGHGRSEGTRACVGSFDDYTATLAEFARMVSAWQPGKPVFLVGHSMGGLIGTLHLIDRQHELKGAILSAPGVKIPDNISKITVFMGKVISSIMPRLGILTLEEAAVSRDADVLAAYRNDPLVYHGKVTARLGAKMIKAMVRIEAEAFRITLPILILQGTGDRLVSPAGAQMLYDRVSSADKKLIFYEGFYHEVFNEPEHDRVLADVEKWLALFNSEKDKIKEKR
jgi:alpha-beta hydrolase superfamily lysophospholipase